MNCPVRRLALSAALGLVLAPVVQAQQQDGAPPSRVSTSTGEVNVEQLATLEYPWGLAVLPDGRLLITEKPGRMRLFDNGVLSEPLQGVPEVVYRGAKDQGGLLDVALDPEFAQNNRVYFSYVEAADKQPENVRDTGDNRFGDYLDGSDNLIRGGVVATGTLDGNQLRDVRVIWRQDPKTIGRGHFGNRLVFGPDGKLYVTSGERMRFEPAQEMSTNLGKVVRLNPDGTFPGDNPFADEQDANGEIWSLGHRNILAAAFDDQNQLWAFEMGPLGGDEANLIEKGNNYGWPRRSNGAHYNGQTIPVHGASDEYTDPVRSWTPVISPSGAIWYDGSLFGPDWQNTMLVGMLTGQGVMRLTFNGEQIDTEERIGLQRRIRDVAQAPDGAILAIVDAEEGGLLRLTPAQ